MVPGQDGAGQVVEAAAAGRAVVALAMRLAVVPAIAGHGSAVAARAAGSPPASDAGGPACSTSRHRSATTSLPEAA